MSIHATKYILTFAITTVCLFVFLFVGEFYVRKVPNVYGDKYQKITGENGIEILVLGSSHAFYGINPEYFSEKAFNAANVSQDLKYDSFILDAAVDNQTQLKFVILPLSIFSLAYDLDSGKEGWRKYKYRVWFDYKDYSFDEKLDIKNHSVILSHPRKLSLLKEASSYYADRFQKNWSDLGWGKSDESVASHEDIVSTGLAAAKRHQKREIMIKDKNLDLLDKMVRLCHERNIKLLLVTTPAHEEYRNHLEPSRVQKLTQIASEFADKYDNTFYLNLLEDDNFGSADYYDADHLNHTGAEKLTLLLNKYVQKLKLGLIL